jgi:hypothetical protein
MMRYKWIYLTGICVAILFIGIVSGVSAQVPGPGGGYNSGFTIQNLSASTASCVFQIYDQSGTSVYSSSSISINPNGSYFVYVGNLSIPNGLYSAVVSCDQPVRSVVNMSTSNGYAASYEAAASSDISSILYAPGLYKNYYGYNSSLVVQNASNSLITITLNIYPLGSGTPITTITAVSVPPGASRGFDLASISIPNGAYSGKVTSEGPVVGVVNIWNSSGQQYQYTAMTTGTTAAYAPVLMKNYYGFNTALTIQNVSGSSGIITITYSSSLVITASIPANGSILRYTPNESLPNGWIGSARIDSSVPVVALVNESGAFNRAASYTAFGSGFLQLRAPIVLKRYYGFSSSVTCQNISNSSPTNVTITYSNGYSQPPVSVSPNGTVVFYQPNAAGLPDGFNGSATITSDSQPIVCVVNQNKTEDTSNQDWLLAYDAIGD